MPERRARELLERWRELERKLETADEQTRPLLEAEISRVKSAYEEAVQEALRAQRAREAHGG